MMVAIHFMKYAIYENASYSGNMQLASDVLPEIYL